MLQSPLWCPWIRIPRPHILYDFVSMVWQESPLALSQNHLEEARLFTQHCWARSVHRYVRDHDQELQAHLAAAAHRRVETEHVCVEWTNGVACCLVEGWERGCNADENEKGGVVARPL